MTRVKNLVFRLLRLQDMSLKINVYPPQDFTAADYKGVSERKDVFHNLIKQFFQILIPIFNRSIPVSEVCLTVTTK